MHENPYQSPKSVPKVEKRPAKPPNRYFNAALYGVMAFLGCVMLQAIILEIVWVQTATVRSLAEKRVMLPIHALIACPVGMLIAWWTFRAPQSKWVFAIALLLGLSPWALTVIGITFFGLT